MLSQGEAMREGIVAAGLLLAACAGLDKPGLEAYQDIRAVVVVTNDPATGITTASSEPAAKEEVDVTGVTYGALDEDSSFSGASLGKRSRSKVFVQAEKAADGSLQVFLVSKVEKPISELQLQEKPWTETDPDAYGYVGDPWRKVFWELVEFRSECRESKLICTRFKTDRMKLTTDDVRALLAEGRNEIRISLDKYKIVGARLDADQLVAVLDALGAGSQFR